MRMDRARESIRKKAGSTRVSRGAKERVQEETGSSPPPQRLFLRGRRRGGCAESAHSHGCLAGAAWACAAAAGARAITRTFQSSGGHEIRMAPWLRAATASLVGRSRKSFSGSHSPPKTARPTTPATSLSMPGLGLGVQPLRVEEQPEVERRCERLGMVGPERLCPDTRRFAGDRLGLNEGGEGGGIGRWQVNQTGWVG